MPRALSLLALSALLLAPSCLTPDPGIEPPPDAELQRTLEALRDSRGGAFEDSSERSEDKLLGELRGLAFKHPRHVPTLVANAAVAYEQGDPVGAQRYVDQALDVDPGHVHATLLRVRIAAEGGSLQYASRWLRSQLQLAPDNATVREAYAGILYLQAEYEQAELSSRASRGSSDRTTATPGGSPTTVADRRGDRRHAARGRALRSLPRAEPRLRARGPALALDAELVRALGGSGASSPCRGLRARRYSGSTLYQGEMTSSKRVW